MPAVCLVKSSALQGQGAISATASGHFLLNVKSREPVESKLGGSRVQGFCFLYRSNGVFLYNADFNLHVVGFSTGSMTHYLHFRACIPNGTLSLRALV
jgi:hypothetical protein